MKKRRYIDLRVYLLELLLVVVEAADGDGDAHDEEQVVEDGAEHGGLHDLDQTLAESKCGDSQLDDCACECIEDTDDALGAFMCCVSYLFKKIR